MSTYVEQLVPTSQGSIWTVSSGQGIPVLLCNGGPGCCDYLEPVAELISGHAWVIRFEQRGCGRSTPEGPFDLPTCIQDMELIRQFYGIEKWIVGGHSWGPDLALAYTLQHTDKVLGLIGIAGGVIHRDKAWRKQYHRLKVERPEIEPDYLFPPNLEVNKEMNASWRQYVRRSNLLRKISQLDIPALYVYGTIDNRPYWPVEQLAGLLPQGQFVLIDGAPHLIWATHGKELGGLIIQFLQTFINELDHFS